MRILAVGDFHNDETIKERAIEEANQGNYDLFLGLGDYFTEEYYQDLAQRIKIRKLMITGNRDFNFETPNNEDYDGLFNYVKVNYTDDVDKTDWKLVLLGSTFPEDFQQDVEDWVGDFPSERLIFCSHYPPYMIRDLSYSGSHTGIAEFRELIFKLKPALWFCGHIHEAFGAQKLMRTHVINVAATDSGKAYAVEIDSEGTKNIKEINLS